MLPRLARRGGGPGRAGCQQLQARRWLETSQFGLGHHLSDQAYWEGFYDRRINDPKASQHFEWFLSPDRTVQLLQDVTAAFGSEAPALLYVGCGTSTLGLDLLRAGVCTSLVNTDYSSTAIRDMELAHGTHGGRCSWLEDDCTASSLPSGSFDLVVDKGTMDALGFGDGGVARCQRMVSEMHRLLRPGGIFLQVTDEPPERGRVEVLKLGLSAAAGDGDAPERVGWQSSKWRRVTEQQPDDLFGDDDGFEYYAYWVTK
jgi:SAM-dependent methyltransferase